MHAVPLAFPMRWNIPRKAMFHKNLQKDAKTEHNKWMAIDSVEPLSSLRKFCTLLDGEGRNIAKPSTVEVAGGGMVDRMRFAPVLVRRKGHNSQYKTERVIRLTRGKERFMPTIMLDHEQAEEKPAVGTANRQVSQ